MDRPFVHLLWSLAKKTSLSCRRVPSSCCEPGVAQKENYLSFTFEFKMTAALGAEGRTVQGWVFDFFAFLFFFLDSTSLQSIVTCRLPCVHSLASKSVCSFRFFSCCEEPLGAPARCRTLGPIFRKVIGLKIEFLPAARWLRLFRRPLF